VRWVRCRPNWGGGADQCKDHYGGIDFRIQRHIKAYEKSDDTPNRVKPVSIIIIMYILQIPYDESCNLAATAIADMICIAFFFLLGREEYTGTILDDTSFCLQDVGVYIRYRNLDLFHCSYAELDTTTSVSYKFNTQKHGTRDKKIIQGRSGNALCCPVRGTVRRVKHHRMKKSTPNAPIASYYLTNRRTAIKPKDMMDTLRHSMRINFHRTGIKAVEISARSLRAGSAITIFFGKVDMNTIPLMGCWHSDSMMRYIHGQAQPIAGGFTMAIYNIGAYTFQPYQTVPIIDSSATNLPESTPPPTQICSGTWGQYQVLANQLAWFAKNRDTNQAEPIIQVGGGP
jgi:hypothetical protein